jgi:nucleoid DNA-binding protein
MLQSPAPIRASILLDGSSMDVKDIEISKRYNCKVLSKWKLAREVEAATELPSVRHIEKSKSYKAVTAFFDAIKKALHRGETVKIDGFGKFYLKKIKAKKNQAVSYMYNRKLVSRERMDFPEKTVVWFQPSEALKRFVNEGYKEPDNGEYGS